MNASIRVPPEPRDTPHGPPPPNLTQRQRSRPDWSVFRKKGCRHDTSGIGPFTSAGDAGDLARYGCPPVLLIAFGLVTAPLGLYLWNGLGRFFGLAGANGLVSRIAAIWTFLLLVAVVVTELVFSHP
jgi:hypothetical protein